MTASASPLVLVVSPTINRKGMRATSVRGPLFDGRLADGRLLVSGSVQPLLDAGRALLEEGRDPETPIVMRHSGSNADALRGTVGAAAGLTVSDSRQGKPVFKPWQPYDGPPGVRVSAGVRESDSAAPTQGSPQESEAATAVSEEAA